MIREEPATRAVILVPRDSLLLCVEIDCHATKVVVHLFGQNAAPQWLLSWPLDMGLS